MVLSHLQYLALIFATHTKFLLLTLQIQLSWAAKPAFINVNLILQLYLKRILAFYYASFCLRIESRQVIKLCLSKNTLFQSEKGVSLPNSEVYYHLWTEKLFQITRSHRKNNYKIVISKSIMLYNNIPFRCLNDINFANGKTTKLQYKFNFWINLRRSQVKVFWKTYKIDSLFYQLH